MRFIACLLGLVLCANIARGPSRPAVEIFVALFSMPLFFGFMLKEYFKNSGKKD